MWPHEGMQLHRPRHAPLVTGEKLETAAPSRRCRHPECTTILSRYNTSSTCSRHEGWQDDRQRYHA